MTTTETTGSDPTLILLTGVDMEVRYGQLPSEMVSYVQKWVSHSFQSGNKETQTSEASNDFLTSVFSD